VRLYRGETARLTALLAKYEEQAIDFSDQADAQQKVVELLKNEKPEFLEESKAGDRDIKRWEKQVEEAEKQYKDLQNKQLYFEAQIQWLTGRFPKGVYEDVTGLCKAATLAEIEEQDFSLNPGRYVGVVIEEDGLSEEEFLTELKERHSTLNELNSKAHHLENLIEENLKKYWQ
jgi:type I restriction enzyme M protein